jgi:ATP-binding cassette subfamily B protein
VSKEELIKEDKIQKALRENVIYSMLDSVEREKLNDVLFLETFKLGEVIIQQGEQASGYFIIISGKARVVINDEITVAHIKKGAGVGEQSLLFEKDAGATVRASSKIVVAKLPKDSFKKLIKEHPDLERRFKKIVSQYEQINSIKKLKIFSNLKQSEVDLLIDRIETVQVKKGDFVFHQDDRADDIFIVKKGKVQVLNEHTKKILSIAREGGVLGEVSFLRETNRINATKALEDTTLFRLTRDVFTECVPTLKEYLEELSVNKLMQLEAINSDIEEEDEKEVIEPEFKQADYKIRRSLIFYKRVTSVIVNDEHLAGHGCIAMLNFANSKRLPKKWKTWSIENIKLKLESSFLRISSKLEEMGYLTKLNRITKENLRNIKLPAVVMDEENRPCVLFAIKNRKAYIGHPLKGFLELDEDDFFYFWNGEILTAMLVPEFGQESNSAFAIFSRYLPLIAIYREFIFWIIGISVILMLFGLVSPFFTETIIDKVLVFSDKELLNLMLLGSIFIGFFQLTSNALRSLLIVTVMQRLESIVNVRLFNHILNIPDSEFSKFKTGDYTSRFAENRKLLAMISSTGMMMIIDVGTTIFYLFFLFSQNASLTAIGFLFVVALFALIIYGSPILRANDEKIFQANAKNSSFIIQMVTGMKTIKSLANEKHFFNEGMDKLSAKLYAEFYGETFDNFMNLMSSALVLGATLTILSYGAYLVLNNQMSVGEFVAFNSIYGMLITPLARLAKSWDIFQEIKVSYERINDILGIKTEQSEENYEVTKLEGHIRFENVNLKYEGAQRYTLKNISLEIQPSQKVAFIGKSGCGKSSLLNLVTGFIKPTSGNIYVDGHDINMINPISLRKNIGIVEQEPFLFEGTIRDNIAKANPEIEFEKIIDSATLTGIKEYVDTLPMGFETKVLEGGSNLSGGERQKIAISRAIINEPGILVLDEATSSLDKESETTIQKNIDNVMKNSTILAIAHRLNTILNSDLIVVIDDGEIIEKGTHNELINKKGLYYYLYTSEVN